jgi:hypothetical protein
VLKIKLVIAYPNFSGDKIKQNEMGGACSAYGARGEACGET